MFGLTIRGNDQRKCEEQRTFHKFIPNPCMHGDSNERFRLDKIILSNARLAQSRRAFLLHGKGSRFES